MFHCNVTQWNFSDTKAKHAEYDVVTGLVLAMYLCLFFWSPITCITLNTTRMLSMSLPPEPGIAQVHDTHRAATNAVDAP